MTLQEKLARETGKEIYLYNPVNHFQINETAFVVGLGKQSTLFLKISWQLINDLNLKIKGAGKLQYLNNLTQIATVKRI